MRTCSECTYMNFEKEHDHDGKFWCEAKYEWFYSDSAECWRFCSSYNRDSSVAESYRKYSKDKQSSGCFITTMVCDIMGFDDDNIYLSLLRKFRDNYLQKNPNTIEILEEYDFVGPLISNALKNDNDRLFVSQNLFINNIVPIVNDICSNKYYCAIKKYTDMTLKLIEKYNIEVLTLKIPSLSNYDYNKDYSCYGHGRISKKMVFRSDLKKIYTK